MITILWAVYLSAAIFFTAGMIFDLKHENEFMNHEDNRIIIYIITSVLWAVWYMYFLH